MKYLCALAVAGAALCGTAQAQSCRSFTPVQHAPVYSTPVYKAPVATPVYVKEVVTAVPVLVPAYQFQYVPPACQQCPTPSAQVQAPQHPGYIPGYGQNMNPGYGQAPAYGQPPAPGYGQAPGGPPVASFGANDFTDDRIRLLARALLDEMQRQANEDQDGGPPVASDPYGTPAPPVPPVAGPPTGNVPPAPAPRPGDPTHPAAGVAYAALLKNCAACHTGPGSKGDYQLFSQPNSLNPQANLSLALDEVASGRMPPRSSQFRLTPDEVQALRAWLGGR